MQHITSLSKQSDNDYMRLDSFTIQNLEIFINIVTLHNQKLKLKNKSYYGKRIL